MCPDATLTQAAREALAAAVPPERLLAARTALHDSRNPIRPGERPEATFSFLVLYFFDLTRRGRPRDLRFIVGSLRTPGLQLGRDF